MAASWYDRSAPATRSLGSGSTRLPAQSGGQKELLAL